MNQMEKFFVAVGNLDRDFTDGEWEFLTTVLQTLEGIVRQRRKDQEAVVTLSIKIAQQKSLTIEWAGDSPIET